MDELHYFGHHLAGNVALAVRNNDVDALCELIANGADVDVFDNRRFLPIHEASQKGFLSCLEILFSCESASNNLNTRTREGQTCVFLAAAAGHSSILEFLITKGSDVNIPNNEGETPMHIACKKGYADCVEVLLESGADPNYRDEDRGYSPLIRACLSNQIKCISLLLKHPQVDIEMEGDDGCTALTETLGHRDGVAMRMLLEKGAKAKGSPGSVIPIHICCLYGTVEMIKLLLEHGADIKAMDENQRLRFAIEYVFEGGDPEVLKFALRNGASQIGKRTQRKDNSKLNKREQIGMLYHFVRLDHSFRCRCLSSMECSKYLKNFDVILDFIQERIDNLLPSDLEMIVDRIARAKPSSFLHSLHQRSLLDVDMPLRAENGWRWNIEDLAVKKGNFGCAFYLLKLVRKTSEDRLYAKGAKYIQDIIFSWPKETNNFSKPRDAHNCLELLLKYALGQNNKSLLETLGLFTRMSKQVVGTLLRFDIHEGTRTWRLYDALAKEHMECQSIGQILATPSSLKHKCRHVIRSSLRNRIRCLRDISGVPNNIVDYLEFKDRFDTTF